MTTPEPVLVSLPVEQVVTVNAMTSVDTVTWWCRLCNRGGSATRRPSAVANAITHLVDEHHATRRRAQRGKA